ncbi:OLC1v1030735C1 [Oldenlandia corymbosa var. corymbosa]|uniref:OLC1v1030735C1 n=1 Tax=Oldenlandia corymbosa var. corymbosa TaxID=529605 RepID=A0AAV1CIQ2_OLDCO|nr:OLC1v1030735C1 [Oldenlandia corymbosa var. corymbosa]
MEKLGYSSTYVKRTGQKRDGCGIFYKTSSAELVFEEKIYYNDLVESIEDTSALSVDKDGCSPPSQTDMQEKEGDHGNPNDPRVRLKRDCVGIMAVFKLKDPSLHHVIIANTHLYWDPEWADVKLAQAEYLLARILQFKQLVLSKLGCTPSVVVAGDFNSVPGDKVYQYLVSGASDVRPSSESSDDQPVPLSSVYAHTRGEPDFTNCTPGFTGTLDYIFFSPSGNIRPVSFLELPEPESPDVVGGLPNHYHPSDHLPIGAEFEVVE